MALDKEFVEKLKEKSVAELTDFKSAIKIAKRICTFSGVSSILLALMMTNVFTVAMAVIVVSFFSGTAVRADETDKLVDELLEAKGVR